MIRIQTSNDYGGGRHQPPCIRSTSPIGDSAAANVERRALARLQAGTAARPLGTWAKKEARFALRPAVANGGLSPSSSIPTIPSSAIVIAAIPKTSQREIQTLKASLAEQLEKTAAAKRKTLASGRQRAGPITPVIQVIWQYRVITKFLAQFRENMSNTRANI
jgi:hypothetical protein